MSVRWTRPIELSNVKCLKFMFLVHDNNNMSSVVAYQDPSLHLIGRDRMIVRIRSPRVGTSGQTITDIS